MRVLRGLDRRLRKPTCLALGVFDGVHLGHQEVIGAAVRNAEEEGLVPAVLTFEPHPDSLLAEGGAPPLLTTTEEKLALLRGLGVRLAVIAEFDSSLAGTPADRFIREVLAGRLRARSIVAGQNWRFGAGGEGNPGLLRRLADELGYRVTDVPSVSVNRIKVSSTRIRQALLEGGVELGARLLGRRYGVSGTVVPGEGIGRVLGFPTGNLAPPPEKLIPPDGIYACLAGKRRFRPAAVYVGSRPTFGDGGPRRVEVHFLHCPPRGRLRGRRLSVEFVAQLRGDRRFTTTEALVAQMAQDCAEAARVLDSLHEPDSVV